MEQKGIRISRRLFKKHKRDLDIIKNFILDLKTLLNEKFICGVLIGSRARLDFNIGSDFDLILVGDWIVELLFDRIDEIQKKIEIPLLPIDYFLYRPKEILKLIEQGNPMILDGFIEGVSLLNNNYYSKIQNIVLKKISSGILSKKEDLWEVHE